MSSHIARVEAEVQRLRSKLAEFAPLASALESEAWGPFRTMLADELQRLLEQLAATVDYPQVRFLQGQIHSLKALADLGKKVQDQIAFLTEQLNQAENRLVSLNSFQVNNERR